MDDDTYTQDGTVDTHGNPANKTKTGNWRACKFILGNYMPLIHSKHSLFVLKFVDFLEV